MGNQESTSVNGTTTNNALGWNSMCAHSVIDTQARWYRSWRAPSCRDRVASWRHNWPAIADTWCFRWKIVGIMNGLKEGWFSELSPLWPGVSLSLEVTNVLHAEKSEFQDILVVETKSHGKVLALDGIIQCTEYDEFSYQEMISFLPLCSHPDPKKVLIVGGGDGGVAREVAKHPSVESITQVEIDPRVVAISKKYLPFMGSGLSDPKLTLFIGDGFKFMAQHQKQFDVIITDSSDPVGPAVSLFEQSYYELMRAALRDGGIVCSQAGTVWVNMDQVSSTLAHCRATFNRAAYACASVPTYPTGQIGFALGSCSPDTNFKKPLHIFTEDELEKMNLRYYSAEVHTSAFVLPRFAQKELNGSQFNEK